jgi:hypothetical protein
MARVSGLWVTKGIRTKEEEEDNDDERAIKVLSIPATKKWISCAALYPEHSPEEERLPAPNT